MFPAASRFRGIAVSAAVLIACSGVTAGAASVAGATRPASSAAGARAVAARSATPTRPDAAAEPEATATPKQRMPSAAAAAPGVAGTTVNAGSTPPGLTPTDLRSAYSLGSASVDDGTGATVAIIGTDDDPEAESDLATYRSEYGLPACTAASGCFTKVNGNGQPSPLPLAETDGPGVFGLNFTQESAAALDMVSAICPNCRILLVETSDDFGYYLGTAVNSAVALGARYVVIDGQGYGGYEPGEAYNQDFDHPGVAITVPGGTTNFDLNSMAGTEYYSYPAALPYVTAVGGTVLTSDPGTIRGWSETVWNDTTSGCAPLVGKPSWQSDTGCSGRTYNDVAAAAAYLSFYNTANGDTGWEEGASTTFSAAIIGAVYALAGTPAADTFPVTYPYVHSADLYPVTSGNDTISIENGVCQGWAEYLCAAGPGYNGPAGWGTPDGITAFMPPGAGTVAMINPGEQATKALPLTVDLTVQALDSGGSALTYAATGLPPGLTIDPSTGTISGTLETDYTGTTTVTATDSGGASARITIPWDAENGFLVTNPGTQVTTPGNGATLSLRTGDNDPDATATFSASGLPPGLAINSATGVISGTTTPTIGSYPVTVTATDSTGTTSTVTFTWNVWNKITVRAPSDQQSYVGASPIRVTVTAADSDPADGPLAYGAAGLPPGLTIDPQTGVISGSPTSPTGNTVTVTATDQTGSAGTATFYWTVVPEPTPAAPVRNPRLGSGVTTYAPLYRRAV